MNFQLEYIELHIDDSYIEIGERLLQKDALGQLFESEKNLWLATISDGKNYEVEIHLVNNKVRATTCDCPQYQETKVCTHIAAVLLQLRIKSKEKQETIAKDKPTKKPVTSSKITVNAILNQIKSEDLVQFVKTYARSNRNFAVALKTKFAPQVPVENNQAKYLQVLHGSISLLRNSKGGFTSKNMKQLLKIAHQMIAQAEDMIALNNYAEGVAILEACLIKTSPTLRFNAHPEENQNFVFRILQIFWEISHKDIAPKLKEQIWNFARQEGFKSFYFQENVEAQFFHFLLELASTNIQLELLLQSLQQIAFQADLTPKNQVNLISFQLSIYEKLGNAEASEALIQEHIEEDAILLMAMEDAFKREKYQRVKALADSRLGQSKVPKNIHQVDDLLLQVALKEKDTAKIAHYAQKRFLQTYQFEYYEQLKKSSSKLEKLYPSVLEQIQRQPYTVHKRDAIAALHLRENNISALLDYFESIRSLDLLQKHDEQLLKKHKKRIYALYIELVLEYINNHIGRKSSQKASSIIQHLRNIGARDLADQLVEIFRTDYAERHTLMEEIQFF